MSERTTSLPDTELSGGQRFLYCTGFGRLLLRGVLIRPWVSRVGGWYMSRRLSAMHIKGFIRSGNIDMSDYADERYGSFNAFFTRRVRPGARPVDPDPAALIAPCDARLSAYEITPDSRFRIKGGDYTIAGLLASQELAGRYAGGLCLIFRLAVDNYHRYCYLDDGEKGEARRIPGVFHTVHPIALGMCDIYKENARECSVLNTAAFGEVAQVEVGAMMVGRIRNLHGEYAFKRGEEKGWFEFGGSTIVVLLQKGAATLDEELLRNTREGLETHVRLGERIGTSSRRQKA